MNTPAKQLGISFGMCLKDMLFWDIFCSFWDCFGIVLGSFWDNFVIKYLLAPYLTQGDSLSLLTRYIIDGVQNSGMCSGRAVGHP